MAGQALGLEQCLLGRLGLGRRQPQANPDQALSESDAGRLARLKR